MAGRQRAGGDGRSRRVPAGRYTLRLARLSHGRWVVEHRVLKLS